MFYGAAILRRLRVVFTQFLAQFFEIAAYRQEKKSRLARGRSPARNPQAIVAETLDARLTPTGLTAVPDSFTVQFDPNRLSPITFEVLDNDTGGVGVVRITNIITPPYGCAMIRSPGGGFDHYAICFYVPALYVGNQSFQYTICDDSGATSTATVSLTLTSRFVNNADINPTQITEMTVSTVIV